MSDSQLVLGEEGLVGFEKLTSDVENRIDPSENIETNAAEILSEGEGVDEEGVREEDQSNGSSKPFRFPLSRVKIIAKTVPSVNLINSEALVLIERACELFVRNFSRNIYQVTVEEGKKTVSRAHVDSVVRTMNQYEFLDGMLDES
ncbi:DNA polymerase epsilon subunit 4 [Paragonimus westermani]|uniref:DNA polymerase epsilon subunit 4 n=1 Tax=Paragonimus westermani TaxID=34504 RepID=A0A5J4NAC8_9TREM|nr:DNA polymerase epsilon subunit 4 [Paragonimus westermani]